MEPIEFCRWLQGYFEIREASGKDKEQLSQAQINLIEEHLKLVFSKVTGNQKTSLSEYLESIANKTNNTVKSGNDDKDPFFDYWDIKTHNHYPQPRIYC